MAATRHVLLVFLRHWGCPFCREMLSDLATVQPALSASGVELVFVHMGTPERAKPYFEHYRMPDVQRISDPKQLLYQDATFALPRKAIFRHIFDREALASFFKGITLRHGIEFRPREDRTQMPGVFLLQDGQVVRGHRYRSIAEKPNFLHLARNSA